MERSPYDEATPVSAWPEQREGEGEGTLCLGGGGQRDASPWCVESVLGSEEVEVMGKEDEGDVRGGLLSRLAQEPETLGSPGKHGQSLVSGGVDGWLGRGSGLGHT